MNWIKKNFEILIGYLLAAVSIFLGIFIIYHGKQIAHFKDIAVNKLHMYNFFDFINIYIFELIKLLSHYINNYPILYGVILIIIGLSFIYVSKKLKESTIFDKTIAYYYLLTASLILVTIIVFLFEVYGFYSLFYLIFFIVLVYYTINRRKLNENYRKFHFIVLIAIYAIAYFMSQLAVYDNLNKEKVLPLDVMSINFFFISLLILATLCLINYVFLKRTLPTKQEQQEDKLSRRNKKKRDYQINRKLQAGTNSTIEKLSSTSLKLDEKIILSFKKMMNWIQEKINLQEDDIPFWFKRPKWIKPFLVEILLSGLMFIITIIELNNRNILFDASKFNVVKMQYFYEWINLVGLLIVIIAYIYFTIRIHLKNKGHFGQLFTISFLTIKIVTSIYLMIFKGINLALFIPPIMLLMFIFVIPLYLIHIRKHY
ncbi:lipoteichoic acid stability factor AuxA [Macrococcus animalis]|uniref:lipoteichoic acid stability factor AuxA n=1 Tax=Macrococcus animalis TaxID=3395467 RepID=UPI0039BE278F